MIGPLYGAFREFCSRCERRIAVLGAHGAPARERSGVEGSPRATEPGSGAEPRSTQSRALRRAAGLGGMIAVVAIAASERLTMSQSARRAALTTVDRVSYTLSPENDRFLEDLSKRSFQFFWEQADPSTGIVRDRARSDGSPHDPDHRDVGSIAATGFGLTALCIAADRGWRPRPDAQMRAAATLKTFAERQYQSHGWFHHFVLVRSGERVWNSEVSSIDTALLVAGVLTVRQCFGDDPAIVRSADAIYRRIDFQWMLNGHPTLLSHGWYPERGFIANRWAEFSEAMVLLHLSTVHLRPHRASALPPPVLPRVG